MCVIRRSHPRLVAAQQRLAVGDVILTEILQGARDDRHAHRLEAMLDCFDRIAIVDRRIAIEGARFFRHLRSLGVTIRKRVDTLIATRCILDDVPLLYSDPDFDPFVTYLGPRSAIDLDPGVS